MNGKERIDYLLTKVAEEKRKHLLKASKALPTLRRAWPF